MAVNAEEALSTSLDARRVTNSHRLPTFRCDIMVICLLTRLVRVSAQLPRGQSVACRDFAKIRIYFSNELNRGARRPYAFSRLRMFVQFCTFTNAIDALEVKLRERNWSRGDDTRTFVPYVLTSFEFLDRLLQKIINWPFWPFW